MNSSWHFLLHIWAMQWVYYNGAFVPAAQPLFTAQNRGFRYGDGVFETVKVFKNALLLWPYHTERLMTSLQLLQINTSQTFTTDSLLQHILQLCQRNHCNELGRVRLAVYRNENNEAEYVIEATALSKEIIQWNTRGWTLDIYPHARKSCDAFANLKSANFLPYVLAGRYAQEKGLDETLVLNAYNNLCDGSKTNLFLIKDGELFTPALHQGCVNGTMRRYAIDTLKKEGYTVHQQTIAEEDLLAADEVFVTNAIVGVRWVAQFRNRNYTSGQSREIYKLLFAAAYR